MVSKSKENEFMKEAIKEAYKCIKSGHGGPFGVVIVKDNKIIGRGHNRVWKNNDSSSHGEVMAIRTAWKNINAFNLNGAEIYTTGEPCPMCLGAILWARINKIYYGCSIHDAKNIGFDDEAFYKKLSLKTNKLNIKQIEKEACLELYKEYKKLNLSRY